MALSGNSLMSCPASQMIIDVDLFKEPHSMEKDVPQVPDDAMDQSRLGTLYTRVSPRPALFADKGARDQFFKGAKWQSIPGDVGCWICNASKSSKKLAKKDQMEAKKLFT